MCWDVIGDKFTSSREGKDGECPNRYRKLTVTGGNWLVIRSAKDNETSFIYIWMAFQVLKMVMGPSFQRAQAITLNARREGQIMKFVGFKAGLSVAILTMALSGGVSAMDYSGSGVAKGSFKAKAQYCTDCHGSSGRGYFGYFPIPRLAGQTPEYTDNQLRAFAEGSRDRIFAMNMSKVHGLNPSLRSSLASYFSNLDPKPLARSPKHLVETGRKIYEEGVPDANLPACLACHGPDAKGAGANPRLAGQLYPYTLKALRNWTKERGQNPAVQDTSGVMTPIVQNMTKAQMSALAAYLSTIR